MDAWLAGLTSRAEVLDRAATITLFDRAHQAIWSRSKNTLGEVTLTAIAERVLFVAAEEYPFLSALTIDPDTGIKTAGPTAHAGAAKGKELMQALTFVLVELLTVLGSLTAEILTPDLHAALLGVALPKATRPQKERKRRP